MNHHDDNTRAMEKVFWFQNEYTKATSQLYFITFIVNFDDRS